MKKFYLAYLAASLSWATTYAVQTLVVDGKAITTGRVYQIEDLQNGASDTATLKKLLDSQIPIFVDFYAPWCGPCQQMKPIFQALANECDNVLFIAVNGDDHRSVIQEFNVRAYPTFLSFKQGRQVRRITGGKSKNQLKNESGIC